MDFQKKTLENGLTIKSCKMQNTHSVTIILVLNGGMAWEPLSQNGITHFVEHLCFRRCAGMEQKDFYYKIERTGGWLRGVTDRDSVLFEITVHPKYFNQAASIVHSLFLENRWTHQDIGREKQVVCTEILDRSTWCYHQMMNCFFDNSPAGRFIAGTTAKVKRLSRPQLVFWKKNLFCTQNARVIIAGDITDDGIAAVDALFSLVPKGDPATRSPIKPKSFLKRCNDHDRYFTDDGNYLQIAISFDIDGEKISHIQAEMLKQTLCSGLYSPFKLRLREELGLFYEIDAKIESFSFGGQLSFIFDVHKEHAVRLLDEITMLLIEQKHCLDQKAFECVKAAVTDGKESIQVMSQEFAYLLLEDEITTPQSYLDRNQNISYEEVQQAAREIFRSKNMVVILHDVPFEQELCDQLYNKKELLRTKLGD